VCYSPLERGGAERRGVLGGMPAGR